MSTLLTRLGNACGDDISSQSSDGRLLDGSFSVNVLNIYRRKERLDEIGKMDRDKLVTGGNDPKRQM